MKLISEPCPAAINLWPASRLRAPWAKAARFWPLG